MQEWREVSFGLLRAEADKAFRVGHTCVGVCHLKDPDIFEKCVHLVLPELHGRSFSVETCSGSVVDVSALRDAVARLLRDHELHLMPVEQVLCMLKTSWISRVHH